MRSESSQINGIAAAGSVIYDGGGAAAETQVEVAQVSVISFRWKLVQQTLINNSARTCHL